MFEELKKLLKQSAIYGIGSIVTPLAGFVMLPLYARYLTPAEYGVLAITVVVTSFLSLVFSLGINSGIIRFYFAYTDKKDKDAVVVSSLAFSVLSSIALILVLWPLARGVSSFALDFDKGELYFKIIIFTSAMNTGIVNGLAVLRAEEKPPAHSTITVLRLILTLLLNVVFVVVLKRKVQGILEAGLISNAIANASVTYMVLRGKSLSISWERIKEVLAFGLPLVPGGIAALVLTLSDRYFLKHFATMREVGLYAVVFGVASAIKIVVIEPFRVAWPPYMLSVLDKPDAKDIYKKVLVYFSFISVWAGLVLSVFAREGLIILATPAYYSAYRLVPVLVLSDILLGMCAVFVAGIHISKKTKYASYSFIAAAAVNLMANFLLVPVLGMTGAALASVSGYMALSILYFRASQRLYYIEHEFRRVATVFAVGIALYCVSAVATARTGFQLSIAIKVVCVLLYPVMLYFVRFYAREELARVRQVLRDIRGRLPF